jgi:hypothetical protein
MRALAAVLLIMMALIGHAAAVASPSASFAASSARRVARRLAQDKGGATLPIKAPPTIDKKGQPRRWVAIGAWWVMRCFFWCVAFASACTLNECSCRRLQTPVGTIIPPPHHKNRSNFKYWPDAPKVTEDAGSKDAASKDAGGKGEAAKGAGDDLLKTEKPKPVTFKPADARG